MQEIVWHFHYLLPSLFSIVFKHLKLLVQKAKCENWIQFSKQGCALLQNLVIGEGVATYKEMHIAPVYNSLSQKYLLPGLWCSCRRQLYYSKKRCSCFTPCEHLAKEGMKKDNWFVSWWWKTKRRNERYKGDERFWKRDRPLFGDLKSDTWRKMAVEQ